MSKFEKFYGRSFKAFLKAVNPLKKKIIKTECIVHRFINVEAVKLLHNFKYIDEYLLLAYYLKYLNKGVVWADQDFKSINHFYNPSKKKGLFGHDNSLILTERYYKKALKFWKSDKEKSMFYLGAAVHIIQDLTIPQHANVKLLNSHRQYENFVKVTYETVKGYRSNKEPIILKSANDYVKFNSRLAIKTYKKYNKIKNNKVKYHKITMCSLPLAQRTTAGMFITFLRDTSFYKK